MNKERRKRIEAIAADLETLRARIEEVQQEEDDAFNAMPEGLQQSERGEKSRGACEALQEAANAISEVTGHLETASE